MPGKRTRISCWAGRLIAIQCLLASSIAYGIDFNLADFEITTHGGITYGTAIRTDNRDRGLIDAGNGAVVGVNGTATGSRNSDDGDLNFNKGEQISTVLKAVGSIDIKHDNIGFMVRAKAWHDLILGEANPAFGNIPNGYAVNRPLSDSGFSERAKFSGVVFQDAYAYGAFTPGDRPLILRIGNQNIPWGGGWSISGGLSAINPVDLPAMHRPGASPDETGIPIPALYGKLGISENIALEGFYQLRFRPTEIDGCGTFFSTYDYLAEGCNKVFVAGSNDAAANTLGLFGKRAATPDVSNNGQFGAGATYKIPVIATDFGVYAVEYHNRLPIAGAIKTSRVIPVPFIPGDPDGKNVQYFTEYPESIRVLGLTFMTRLDDLVLAGELTYRPNQPVALNATDLFNAFASNTALTELRADATSTALGGAYHGYDLRKVTQVQVSLGDKFKSILGAEEMTLNSELGLKYMNDLPDPVTRRYGRSGIFSVGPVSGVCNPGASSIECSQNGYVSRRSWGYRLKIGLRYPNVINQVDLSPSLAFAHDVRGWAYDAGFNEGRHTLITAVRATYQKMYFAELNWTNTWGGYYNYTRDRSWLSASAGLRF